MAYKPWSDYIWTEVWNNGAYALDVQWRHRIDPIANKIWYSVCQWRIRKITNWFYDADCPIGIASYSGNRATVTKSVNLENVSSVTHNLTDVGHEVTAKADGSYDGTAYLHVYCKPSGVTGPVPTGWYTKNITSLLPKIDRGTGTTTISLNSSTFSSITLNIKSNVCTSLGRYRVNGGSWVEFTTSSSMQVTNGGTMTKVFSGLSPNTSYIIEVQCRRDYNELWAPVSAITVTTNKPSLPTISDLKLTSNVYNQQIYTWSGAYGTGHPSNLYGAYEYRVNGGDWQSTSTPSATLSCSPNTTYKFEVRLRDYYGQYSSTLSSSAITPKPSAPSGGTITMSNITYNSAKMSYSGFKAGAGASIARYDVCIGGSSDPWVNNGLNTSYTKTGLSPNTTYTAYVRAVDNYGSSNTVTITFTTPKPSAPTKGRVSVSEITTNSAKFTISGFGFGAGATWGKFRQCFSNEPWQDLGKTTVFTRTGLNPNTEYTMCVDLVDNYGTSSGTVYATFKTLEDQAKINVKVDDVWKKGKAFYKSDGNFKKAKKVYIKVGGVWKQAKT